MGGYLEDALKDWSNSQEFKQRRHVTPGLGV
jgi:hypothetical protein